MREKYGLIIYWDVDNSCYIASTTDLLIGKAMGATRGEALAALEEEVTLWEETSRQLHQSSLPSGWQEEQPELPGISLEVEDDSAPVDEAAVIPVQETGPFPRHEDGEVIEVYRSINLVIAVEYDPIVPIIYLSGECDLCSLPGLKRQLREIVGARFDRIIVDMTKMVHADSACLGALLDSHKTFREQDGVMGLVAAKASSLYRILRITRFNTIMEVHTSLDEARASFG